MDDRSVAAKHAGIEQCSQCRSGTYSDVPGSQLCQVCLAGTYAGSGASMCVACEAGRYLSDDRHHADAHSEEGQCLPCKAGRYSTSAAAQCKDCEDKTVACSDGLKTSCPLGSVSNDWNASCVPCPARTYRGRHDLHCLSCPSPAFTDTERTMCHRCTGTTYSRTSFGLVLCLQGRMLRVPLRSDEVDGKGYMKLPPKLIGASQAAIDAKTNYDYHAGVDCLPCPSCASCSEGRVQLRAGWRVETVEKHGGARCSRSVYTSKQGEAPAPETTNDHTTPSGHGSNVTHSISLVVACLGEDNVRTARCPSQVLSVLVRRNSTVRGQCGRGYTGLLCGECQTHAFKRTDRFFFNANPQQHCQQCKAAKQQVSEYALVVGLVVLALVAVRWARARQARHRRATSQQKWSVLSYNVMSGSLLGDTHESPDGGVIQNPIVDQTTSNYDGSSLLDRLMDLWGLCWQSLRISVSLVQVMNQVIVDITLPPSVKQVLHTLSYWLQLKFVTLGLWHVECEEVQRSYYRMWSFRVFGVPGLLLGLAALHCLARQHKAGTAKELRQAAADAFRGQASMIAYVLYPGICRLVFAMFDCTPVTHCDAVLDVDHGVLCKTDTHNAFRVVAAAVFVLVCLGVPAYLMQQLRTPVVLDSSPEAVCILQVQREFGVDAERAKSAWYDIVDNNQFRFLTSGYRGGFTRWECIDWLRKLTFSATATFFDSGTPARLVFTAALSVFWLVLHCTHFPFRFKEDNILKTIAEATIILTVLLALGEKLVGMGAYSVLSKESYDSFVLALYVFFGMIPIFLTLLCKVIRMAPRFPLLRRLVEHTPLRAPWCLLIRALEPSCDHKLLASISQSDHSVQQAFRVYCLGLAGKSHRTALRQHFLSISEETDCRMKDRNKAPWLFVSAPEFGPDPMKLTVMEDLQTLCVEQYWRFRLAFDWASSGNDYPEDFPLWANTRLAMKHWAECISLERPEEAHRCIREDVAPSIISTSWFSNVRFVCLVPRNRYQHHTRVHRFELSFVVSACSLVRVPLC